MEFKLAKHTNDNYSAKYIYIYRLVFQHNRFMLIMHLCVTDILTLYLVLVPVLIFTFKSVKYFIVLDILYFIVGERERESSSLDPTMLISPDTSYSLRAEVLHKDYSFLLFVP